MNRPESRQNGLFCGLGHHRIARRERCRNLARKDGQGKIPGTDTGKHPPAMEAEVVRLPRRSRQAGRRCKLAFRFEGIVSAEIDGFSHFGDPVGEGFARFLGHQADQMLGIVLQRLSHGPKNVSPRRTAETIPVALGRGRRVEGFVDVCLAGRAHHAENGFRVRRTADSLGISFDHLARHYRSGRQGRSRQQALRGGLDSLTRARLGEVCASGISAIRPIEQRRHRDAQMSPCAPLQAGDRVIHHVFHRHIIVQKAIHKRGVRPVLQKPPNQIWQKILVGSNRRVDPDPGLLFCGGIEGLTHPVQSLEFIIRHAQFVGDEAHGAKRVGIMRRKLRIEIGTGRQHPAGAGEIGKVRSVLGREDRKIWMALHMAVFDFRVPVSALHKPHHEPATGRLGQASETLNDRSRPLLIGLYGEPETGPALKRRLPRETLEDPQRQDETVGLLGIETDIYPL